jgi:hypothetical protein
MSLSANICICEYLRKDANMRLSANANIYDDLSERRDI